MENILFMDLDDTFIYTAYHYKAADAHELQYFVDFFRGDISGLEEILKKEEELDKENVKKFGFTMPRFPTSWVQTFKYFCDKNGRKYSKKNLIEVESLAKIAFQIENDIKPNTAEVLDFLLEQKDELILYTRGDYEHQIAKVKANDLDKWFSEDRIVVVPNKTPEFIRKLVGNRKKDKVYGIGDSYTSDIVPAIEAGIKAIYIPADTWAYENHNNSLEEAKKSKKVIVLKDIIELKTRYDEIFKNNLKDN